MAETPKYTVPAEHADARSCREEAMFEWLGETTARIIRAISNANEQNAVAMHMAALAGALTIQLEREGNERDRLAQRAYMDGRSDGMEQLGKDLGMIETPTDRPDTMH